MPKHAKPLITAADRDRHDLAVLRAKLHQRTPKHAGRLVDSAYARAVNDAREAAEGGLTARQVGDYSARALGLNPYRDKGASWNGA